MNDIMYYSELAEEYYEKVKRLDVNKQVFRM